MATMEMPTFDELKAETARVATEQKMLPQSVAFDGMTYTLERPTDTQVEPMEMLDDPGALDAILGRIVFVATDGTRIGA